MSNFELEHYARRINEIQKSLEIVSYQVIHSTKLAVGEINDIINLLNSIKGKIEEQTK